MKALEILIDIRDSYSRLVKDGITCYTEKVKLVGEAIAELEARQEELLERISGLNEMYLEAKEEIERLNSENKQLIEYIGNNNDTKRKNRSNGSL